MKKVFIGLLVGVCVLMFVSPLLAADSPKGLDLSTLQRVDDTQLRQMRGQNYVPGLSMQYNKFDAPPFLNGFNVAVRHVYINPSGNNPQASRSRVFYAD